MHCTVDFLGDLIKAPYIQIYRFLSYFWGNHFNKNMHYIVATFLINWWIVGWSKTYFLKIIMGLQTLQRMTMMWKK
jgi:hypothetical protein